MFSGKTRNLIENLQHLLRLPCCKSEWHALLLLGCRVTYFVETNKQQIFYTKKKKIGSQRFK